MTQPQIVKVPGGPLMIAWPLAEFQGFLEGADPNAVIEVKKIDRKAAEAARNAAKKAILKVLREKGGAWAVETIARGAELPVEVCRANLVALRGMGIVKQRGSGLWELKS